MLTRNQIDKIIKKAKEKTLSGAVKAIKVTDESRERLKQIKESKNQKT